MKKMKKINAQDVKGIEEKIAKTCGFDVEDIPSFANDYWYMNENQELFTKAEDGTDDFLPLGFSLKPARFVVFPYGGGRSETDILNEARFFETKREAMEYAKVREEDEVREYYRSKPFYRKDIFGYKPREFNELTKDEISIVWERYMDNTNTTDWIVMSLEEFEKQQNVKFDDKLSFW